MSSTLNTVFWPAAASAPFIDGQGTHLLCEWHGCDFSTPSLNQATTLRMLCMNAARDSGLNIVGDVFHQFEPQGVTGTVLLAESHLAIHTWPEAGCVTVDMYVCNFLQDNTHKALNLYNRLKAHFNPLQVSFLQAPLGLQPA